MAIQKITFDAASVSSKMDADINHFLTSGVNGIFYGILGRCQASVSNNYISFQNGYVQVYGIRIYVESCTKISVSLDGSAYGYVIIKIDLGNNTITLEKKEASSAYPTLTQNDLMNGGLIYEFPLCRYTKTSTSITLDTNYDPPSIKNDQTNINAKGTAVLSEASSRYGPVYDGWSTLSYGHCYLFDGITTSNAYDGIISLYVGGTNVIFCGASVGGSGGIVHYRYNGQDCTLSCQLTSSKLYVEDSRGTNQNMQELLDKLFSPNKVLLCYRCGSSIFGLSEDESDKDFTVVIDGYDSCNVVKTDDCDFFTFGRSYFERLKNFDNGCLTYFLCWLDNTLLAKENLVYVDESIEDKLDEFLYIDFKKHFKDWLYRLIAYFGIRLENYKEEKSLYHLYRVESLIKHYKETGKFEYYFSKENKELAMDLKTNLNMEKHLPRLKEIFSYLLSLYKEEEENGN